jgi:hypothetical protein
MENFLVEMDKNNKICDEKEEEKGLRQNELKRFPYRATCFLSRKQQTRDYLKKNIGEFSCLLTTTIKITCSERFLTNHIFMKCPSCWTLHHHSWLDIFFKNFTFWVCFLD